MPLADETQGTTGKTVISIEMRAIPERLRDVTRTGAIKNDITFTVRTKS